MTTQGVAGSIQSLEIHNLKNTAHGKLDFSTKDNKLRIIGLYGQNGTGKTTVIEAIHLLKTLWFGKTFKDCADSIFTCDKAQASINVVLKAESFDTKITTLYDYTVNFQKKVIDDLEQFVIQKETLKAKNLTNNTRLTTLVEFNRDESGMIKFHQQTEKLLKNQDFLVDIKVTENLSRQNLTSFIFSRSFKETLDTQLNVKPIKELFAALHEVVYIASQITVITNKHHGFIMADLALPVSFRIDDAHENKNNTVLGLISLPLRDGLLSEKQYIITTHLIEQVNKVFPVLIPGLSVILEAKQLNDETGKVSYKTQLFSKRDARVIPFSYEADGIKKLFSILYSLITCFTDHRAIIVIDELDASIFEYLLGEILTLLKDSGKGQLIFTSHNLRVLEVLDAANIYFSTTNPNNRFVKLKGVKSSNNLRDVYLRSIKVGGQTEPLYEGKSIYEMRRALLNIDNSKLHQ